MSYFNFIWAGPRFGFVVFFVVLALLTAYLGFSFARQKRSLLATICVANLVICLVCLSTIGWLDLRGPRQGQLVVVAILAGENQSLFHSVDGELDRLGIDDRGIRHAWQASALVDDVYSTQPDDGDKPVSALSTRRRCEMARRIIGADRLNPATCRYGDDLVTPVLASLTGAPPSMKVTTPPTQEQ